MAKKVIITYSGQPITDETGFNFRIEVSGFDILFGNGSPNCKVEYISGTPSVITELAIGTDLAETLQITNSFLREQYVNDLVQYTIVDNTIEVLINADATIYVDGVLNDSIEITTEDVEPSGQNLIYFLYLEDYTLNIYKTNYLGGSTEIFGSFALKKSSVETVLTPIRGTGLEISLEANQTLTFDEFILNPEFTYKTELLKGSQVIFEGYIKPDGIQQSYVNDEWLINIEAVDGLGLLKDLSFVQTNGLQFTGKMSFYDVIKACLDRTRLTMDINTSINVEYVGYAGTNILKDVYVNASRFIKDSNDNVLMDCNEVLSSILNLFSGVITQQDGQWWIYRPNDLQESGYTVFINQTTNATFNKNLNAVLGSQINNFYPHHCDANQQIEVKGAISAYRLNYQYGFLDGFILNPSLNHDALDYDNWTVDEPTVLVNEPLDTSGAIMTTESQANGIFPLTEVLTSTPIDALENQELTLRVKLISFYYKHNFYFKVKTSDGYFLNNSNDWVVGETSNPCVIVPCGSTEVSTESAVTFDLIMPPVPNDCTIELIICRPIYPFVTVTAVTRIAEVTYAQILDNVFQRSGIVGENHTVSRLLPPSSITKENQKVFNGDGVAILIGSIYKDDLETLTDVWTRKDKFESLPLLGISAMDDLRIQPNAVKIFSGNILGEIPYMSVIQIDNILGLFMPIEYDFDYKTKKSQVKLMQFYNSDIGDIQYEVTPDYGNTIKPTIKG